MMLSLIKRLVIMESQQKGSKLMPNDLHSVARNELHKESLQHISPLCAPPGLKKPTKFIILLRHLSFVDLPGYAQLLHNDIRNNYK